MKWLLMVVALVLGAGITWLLTVRRATRTLPEASEPTWPTTPVTSSQDEAAGYGGTPTPASDTIGAAEAWNRDAEDEDALLPHDPDERA